MFWMIAQPLHSMLYKIHYYSKTYTYYYNKTSGIELNTHCMHAAWEIGICMIFRKNVYSINS